MSLKLPGFIRVVRRAAIITVPLILLSASIIATIPAHTAQAATSEAWFTFGNNDTSHIYLTLGENGTQVTTFDQNGAGATDNEYISSGTPALATNTSGSFGNCQLVIDYPIGNNSGQSATLSDQPIGDGPCNQGNVKSFFTDLLSGINMSIDSNTGNETATIHINGVAPTTNAAPGTLPTNTTTPSAYSACSASVDEGLSWVICPVVSVAVDFAGGLNNVIDSLLTLRTAPDANPCSPGYSGRAVDAVFNGICVNGTADTPFRGAWAAFRDLALGLVVIAALLMVISQAAGMEILDAYTIRKVLPRLLFAAIFMTLSWNILELLVWMSDTIGSGLGSLIYAPFTPIINAFPYAKVGGQAIITVLLTTGGILAFGAAVAPAMLVFALGAGVAALITIAVLVFRQLLLVILIVSAPIAIACYILPNTNRVWTVWKNSLISVLVVFPIIAGMIAVGRVFSFTAIVAGGGGILGSIVGIVAYLAPYFLITTAFKIAGGFIGTVHGAVKSGGRSVFGDLGKRRQQALGKGYQEWRQGKKGLSFSRKAGVAVGAVAATENKGALFRPTLAGHNARQVSGSQFAIARSQAFGETPGAKAAMNNPDVLKAMSYGDVEKARQGLAQDWGMNDTNGEISAAVAGMETYGGTKDPNAKIWATNALSSTGAYSNLNQLHKTVARNAGDDRYLAASMFNTVEKSKASKHLQAGMSNDMKLYETTKRNGYLANIDVAAAHEAIALKHEDAFKHMVPTTKAAMVEQETALNARQKEAEARSKPPLDPAT